MPPARLARSSLLHAGQPPAPAFRPWARLVHYTPISRAPPKPGTPAAEADAKRQAHQRQVIAAALQGAEQAKRERAEAEKHRAALDRVQTEEDAVHQRIQIEEARASNRALDADTLAPPGSSLSSMLFGTAVWDATRSRQTQDGTAGQTTWLKTEVDAEEKLRRANGGLPDFPPPEPGTTKKDGPERWITRVVTWCVILPLYTPQARLTVSMARSLITMEVCVC